MLVNIAHFKKIFLLVPLQLQSTKLGQPGYLLVTTQLLDQYSPVTSWRGRVHDLALARMDPPVICAVAKLVDAPLVCLQSRLSRCLRGVSSADHLHGAASSGLGLDNLTLHRRGILRQVERRRRHADCLGRFGLGGLSRE